MKHKKDKKARITATEAYSKAKAEFHEAGATTLTAAKKAEVVYQTVYAAILDR